MTSCSLAEIARKMNDQIAKNCNLHEQHIGFGGERQVDLGVYAPIGQNDALYRCAQCGTIYHGKKSPQILRNEHEMRQHRVTA
jgi:hypothetical protein